MENKMFCNQCQEAAQGIGCVLKGVCGKQASTSGAMDVLLYAVEGLATITTQLRAHDINIPQNINTIINDALFATITNANFDDESIWQRVVEVQAAKAEMKSLAAVHQISLPQHDAIDWQGGRETFDDKIEMANLHHEENEDIRSLKELTLYGLKGMAAYAEHAARLGEFDESIETFIQQALAALLETQTVEAWIDWVLKTGEYGVKTMAMLDKANTTAFGQPELTKVNIGVGERPGILISGHDLHDIEQLLIQTEGTGVDVYTHCEMLPAHYYPAFKKYKHFVGNYGNAWWKQREEFSTFNGPIVFTTNCIVPPSPKAEYAKRMFTSNATGYPGCQHIATDKHGNKDYSAVIEMARHCQPPQPIEEGSILGGFAHHQVLSLADKIIEAVKNGDIRKFIVMAGCDGRMKSRDYYTQFANALPKDCVILTAGCAKYRYNKLPLGDINGIPRVLDAGQCNDSYSLAVIALQLKEVLGLDDINELPIVYNIAWYEQKAVIVLLALLSLGVKNIHLGPTLPAFLSPNVAKILVENFGIGGITDVESDMQLMKVAI